MVIFFAQGFRFHASVTGRLDRCAQFTRTQSFMSVCSCDTIFRWVRAVQCGAVHSRWQSLTVEGFCNLLLYSRNDRRQHYPKLIGLSTFCNKYLQTAKSFLKNLVVAQLVNKFSPFYKTLRLIIVFLIRPNFKLSSVRYSRFFSACG